MADPDPEHTASHVPADRSEVIAALARAIHPVPDGEATVTEKMRAANRLLALAVEKDRESTRRLELAFRTLVVGTIFLVLAAIIQITVLVMTILRVLT